MLNTFSEGSWIPRGQTTQHSWKKTRLQPDSFHACVDTMRPRARRANWWQPLLPRMVRWAQGICSSYEEDHCLLLFSLLVERLFVSKGLFCESKCSSVFSKVLVRFWCDLRESVGVLLLLLFAFASSGSVSYTSCTSCFIEHCFVVLAHVLYSRMYSRD